MLTLLPEATLAGGGGGGGLHPTGGAGSVCPCGDVGKVSGFRVITLTGSRRVPTVLLSRVEQSG